jgi:hypothetical protein
MFKRLRFAKDRLIASARAGSWLGRFRAKARFAAKAVDQDGTLLLMPKEPSLSFIYLPLAALFFIGGAVAGFVS